MKLKLIEGPASVLTCRACKAQGLGGAEPFRSSSSGCMVQPESWYVEETGYGPYCESCASKLAQARDTSRSITQFFSNTEGTKEKI